MKAPAASLAMMHRFAELATLCMLVACKGRGLQLPGGGGQGGGGGAVDAAGTSWFGETGGVFVEVGAADAPRASGGIVGRTNADADVGTGGAGATASTATNDGGGIGSSGGIATATTPTGGASGAPGSCPLGTAKSSGSVNAMTDNNMTGACDDVLCAKVAPPSTGGCTASGCQVVLAGCQGNAWSIAADGASVYWTTSGGNGYLGTVMKVPLGGGVPTTLASGLTHPSAIAVDASSVYWTDDHDGTVTKVPLSGGAPSTIVSGQVGVQFIALDASAIYFAVGGRALMKTSLDGGVPTTLFSGQVNGMAPDATGIYFTTSTALMKVSLDGTITSTLASGLTYPGHVAVDAGNVYYTTSDALMKMPRTGTGTPTTLAFISEYQTDGIAVNDANVYWIELGGVWKVPLNGGTGALLAARQQDHGALAVRGTEVYWLDNPSPVLP